MSKRVQSKAQDNKKFIKEQITRDIQSIKRLVARVEELTLQLDLDSNASQSDSSESTVSQVSSKAFQKAIPKQESDYQETKKGATSRFNFRSKRSNKEKVVVKDHLGNTISVGDYVKFISAPHHNGTVEKFDQDRVYINTSNTLTARKKAPYNVKVQ